MVSRSNYPTNDFIDTADKKGKETFLLFSWLVIVFTALTLLINCHLTPTESEKTEKNPPVINSATSDTSIGVNDTVTLRISAYDTDGSIISYHWKSLLNQKSYLTSDSILRLVYSTAGCDTVKIWVKDNDSLVSDTSIIYLSIHEWPPYLTRITIDTIVRNKVDTIIIRVAAADTDGDASQLRYIYSIDPVFFNDTADSGVLRIISRQINPVVVMVKAIDPDMRTSPIDTIRVLIPSTNANLAKLSVSVGELSPLFDPGNREYADTVEYSVDTVTVTALAQDSTAIVVVNGDSAAGGAATNIKMPAIGENKIVVRVIAADKKTELTYTINLYRKPSSNADLADLSVSAGTLSPNFTAENRDYVDTVEFSVDTVTVTALAEDTAAIVVVNGDTVNGKSTSSIINLAAGENRIAIEVFAQDGITVSVYNLFIYRAYCSDAVLSDLIVSSGKLVPAFSDSVYLYTIELAYGTTSFCVMPTSRSETAVVTVCAPVLTETVVTRGEYSPFIPINDGQIDTVKLSVTAQDGFTRKTYRIAAKVKSAPVPIVLPEIIRSDTILRDEGSYYTADTCITVPAGVTLTIDEGVDFRFRSDTAAVISVFGRLVINGTERNPVTLGLLNNAGNDDTTRWGYIKSDGGTIQLNYVNISRAHRFVNANYGRVFLRHCSADKTFSTATQDLVGVHYATDVLIEYCEFHGNPEKGADCLDLDSITQSGIVRHNKISDFHDDGIDIGSGSPGFLIESNFIKNCSFGISVGERSNVTFKENIVVECREGAMQSHTGSIITAANNTFYKNKVGIAAYRGTSAGNANIKNSIFSRTVKTVLDTITGSNVNIAYSISDTDSLHGTGNIDGDALLTDPDKGDFSLSNNSPCIDKGDPGDSVNVCGGSRIDIGALEYGCKY